MNILIYYADYGTPMYEWIRVHIISELETHGCFVKTLNPVFCESIDKANDLLTMEINTANYDLFITPHNENLLYKETLEAIKKRSVPTVLMCCDNLIVPFVHLRIAPQFDLVWLTSKETKYMFDNAGCHSIFLPYAANPNLIRCAESVNGVGFIGTPYGSRSNMINCLTKRGIPVYCHFKTSKPKVQINRLKEDTISKLKVIRSFMSFYEGRKIIQGAIVNKFHKDAQLDKNEFLHEEFVVEPSELYTVYPRYSLALSSTTARNTGVLKKPLNIINLRAFEIPMSGGIEFCQYSDEIASYFEDGKEIVLFHDFNDMVDKAKYYLRPDNYEIREKMREAARNRAINNHTWWHRFIEVFQYLGIEYE